MRTKTILLTAALSAVTVASSMAQVYSINVVGYITLPITNGFQMLGPQLLNVPTGNNLDTVLGLNWPALTRAYAFSAGTYSFATINTSGGAHWTGNTNAVNAALQVGKGVFFQLPASATPTNVTMVGEVSQGSLTNPVVSGFQIISSIVPQAGGVKTVLGLSVGHLSKTYQYNPTSQTYTPIRTYNTNTAAWNVEPVMGVGEAFFLQANPPSSWVRNFTVP